MQNPQAIFCAAADRQTGLVRKHRKRLRSAVRPKRIGGDDEAQKPLQAQHLPARRSGPTTTTVWEAEDYLLAAELYEVALKRWPKARLGIREGSRIVYDSRRSAVV